MMFFKKKCILCQNPHWRFQGYCSECKRLYKLIKINLGTMGLSQLMDVLIATGIEKQRILNFLTANPYNQGSLMDQILAQLSNNLASGIGVKRKDMTAEDVQRIRQNPTFGSSTQPLND